MVAPGYKGQSFYIDKPSVADNSLITASFNMNRQIIISNQEQVEEYRKRIIKNIDKT
jgi:hypothetical protein